MLMICVLVEATFTIVNEVLIGSSLFRLMSEADQFTIVFRWFAKERENFFLNKMGRLLQVYTRLSVNCSDTMKKHNTEEKCFCLCI